MHAHPNGVPLQVTPNRGDWIPHLPGYPVPGHSAPPFDNHVFVIEDGLIIDPAYPEGIPVDDWLQAFAELNDMRPGEILSEFNFRPFNR